MLKIRRKDTSMAGTLEVGTNLRHEVVINHYKLDVDKEGKGYIVFSPNQARDLAKILIVKAAEAEASGPEPQILNVRET